MLTGKRKKKKRVTKTSLARDNNALLIRCRDLEEERRRLEWELGLSRKVLRNVAPLVVPLALLDKPVAEFFDSYFINRRLDEAKIRTVGQLVRLPERELLRKRDLGWRTLRAIYDGLADWGLSFGMDDEAISNWKQTLQ